jgi:hypothetical protein
MVRRKIKKFKVNEYSTPDKAKDLVGLFMLVVLGYSLTVILFL